MKVCDEPVPHIYYISINHFAIHILMLFLPHIYLLEPHIYLLVPRICLLAPPICLLAAPHIYLLELQTKMLMCYLHFGLFMKLHIDR